jgi:hypothetical protein
MTVDKDRKFIGSCMVMVGGLIALIALFFEWWLDPETKIILTVLGVPLFFVGLILASETRKEKEIKAYSKIRAEYTRKGYFPDEVEYRVGLTAQVLMNRGKWPNFNYDDLLSVIAEVEMALM